MPQSLTQTKMMVSSQTYSIRRRRRRKLRNKERGTNLPFSLYPSDWLLLLSCFTASIKPFFYGLVIRRPSRVRIGRGWQQKVRGDGSGKRYTKTILTMTYLSLIFVFSAVQPLICASTVTPSFGKVRLWIVASLRPHNINIRCYDW